MAVRLGRGGAGDRHRGGGSLESAGVYGPRAMIRRALCLGWLAIVAGLSIAGLPPAMIGDLVQFDRAT